MEQLSEDDKRLIKLVYNKHGHNWFACESIGYLYANVRFIALSELGLLEYKPDPADIMRPLYRIKV